MLSQDLRTVGNRLLAIRKRTGLTQAEIAEKAGLSDRAYADIERGSVNMRIETLIKICNVLHITPNTLLEDPDNLTLPDSQELLARLNLCTPAQRATAVKLLTVYLESL